METPISPDDPAVKGGEAFSQLLASAPNAKIRKNRLDYALQILNRAPGETLYVPRARITNPNPPEAVEKDDRLLFTFAASTAGMIIAERARKSGDTPEERAKSVFRFMSECAELAPHANVLLIVPTEAAPEIDEDALETAINVYFTTAKQNRLEAIRRECARAMNESEARQ